MWRILLPFLMTTPAFADQPACGPRELQAQLRPSYPVFAEAMKLKETLMDAGFKVECVLASKMENMLKGQKGAAQFRTDHGIFEALFAAEPNGFGGIEIIEAGPQPPYKYLVRDSPGSAKESFVESSKRIYFVKRPNMILVAWRAELAPALERALKDKTPEMR